MHTKDALETVNRIIGVFEPEAQREVRMQFSSALMAVVSQRLIPRVPQGDGRDPGLVAAVEVLVNTPRVRDCLQDPNKTGFLREALEQGGDMYGMQSFDQDLMRLLRDQVISRDTAVSNSTSPADFELRLRGIQSSQDARFEESDGTHASAVLGAPRSLAGNTLELESARPIPKRK
jgi:twitching motility protein PilT